MKIIGLTLRASLAAALLTTASSAFAFGGLFDGGLFKSAEPEYVVDDASFFAGEALTIGEMAAPSPFFASAASESYSGCASCGDETGVVYGGGIPAAVDCCDPCAFVCDPCVQYVGAWGGYPAPYVPGQPVRNVLRGVRNLLSNCSLFCQPAYVCDPCWTVCDPCWSPDLLRNDLRRRIRSALLRRRLRPGRNERFRPENRFTASGRRGRF